MREFEQRKKVRTALYSRLSIILLIVGVFILGKATIGAYQKYRSASGIYIDVAREESELSLRKDRLSADIERLQTVGGIEAEIRNKFGMAKEGEKVLILIDRTASTSGPVVPKASAFDALKSLFKR